MRRIADEGRFYSLADSQQEHLRADLSRALHTPLYLPHYHHYGGYNSGRHDNAHVIPTMPCFSPHLPQAVTSPAPLLQSRFSLNAPSSPDVLRKALATLCLSSRGAAGKKRNTNNLRVTFADEIQVDGRDPAASPSPSERSPSPGEQSQPPRSALKTSVDVHRVFRDRGDRPDSFDQIPEDEEWKRYTESGECRPGSPGVFSPTPRSPSLSLSLSLSPLARPDHVGDREARRASDTDAVSCRKELFGSEEEDLRRGSTGSINVVERPASLDVTSHTPAPHTAPPALPTSREQRALQAGGWSRPEQRALQSLGPEYNYATYPAAKHCSLSVVRDVSVVARPHPQPQHCRAAPPLVTTPSEELYADHPAYLTFPPMTHGWTKTLPRPVQDRQTSDAVSVGSWPSLRSEVCAEKGSSNGSLSYPSSASCYTAGSSGGSWSFVTQADPQGGHSPGKAPSSLCDLDPASSAPADHGNGHRSLPLPAVTDFMLQRYLGEVNRVFQTYPSHPSSNQTSVASTDSDKAYHSGSDQSPPIPLPLPSSILPPDMRGKSVSFAPLGRYLFDLLNSPGPDVNGSSNGHPPDRTLGAYLSRFRDCTSFSSPQDSWRALTDMARFQSQFYYTSPQRHDTRHTPSPSSGYPASSWSSVRGGDGAALSCEEIQAASSGDSKAVASRQQEERVVNSHSSGITHTCGQNGGEAKSEGAQVLPPPEVPEYAQSEPGDRQDADKLVDVEQQGVRPRSLSHADSSLCRDSRGPGSVFQHPKPDARREERQGSPCGSASQPASVARPLSQAGQQGSCLGQEGRQSSTPSPVREASVSHGHKDKECANEPAFLSGSQNQGSRPQSPHDQRSRSQGSVSTSHLLHGSNSAGQTDFPYVPLQAGSSEEMAADFLLFCAAVKASFVPPPANSDPSSAHRSPPGFPFPDFNPNWFRFLPGFPK